MDSKTTTTDSAVDLRQVFFSELIENTKAPTAVAATAALKENNGKQRFYAPIPAPMALSTSFFLNPCEPELFDNHSSLRGGHPVTPETFVLRGLPLFYFCTFSIFYY